MEWLKDKGWSNFFKFQLTRPVEGIELLKYPKKVNEQPLRLIVWRHFAFMRTGEFPDVPSTGEPFGTEVHDLGRDGSILTVVQPLSQNPNPSHEHPSSYSPPKPYRDPYCVVRRIRASGSEHL
jgi:hypothetical protein